MDELLGAPHLASRVAPRAITAVRDVVETAPLTDLVSFFRRIYGHIPAEIVCHPTKHRNIKALRGWN
jgi:hypothetical protein